MAQNPPEFKSSPDSRVGTGKCEPFSDDPITDAEVIDTRLPHDLRDGFTRKYFVTPSSDHDLPEEVDVWSGAPGKRSKSEGFPDTDSLKGRIVSD
jgi:hypothetical protein